MNEFEFNPVTGIDPKDLVGNVNLALHHHMAPPGEETKENDEKGDEFFEFIQDLNPQELVGNIDLALHHHMAPPSPSTEEEEGKGS